MWLFWKVLHKQASGDFGTCHSAFVAKLKDLMEFANTLNLTVNCAHRQSPDQAGCQQASDFCNRPIVPEKK